MTEQVLVAAQILVVAAVYLFAWLVVRTARRDLAGGPLVRAGAPDDSTILSASEVERARREAGIRPARLVVVSSPHLRSGQPFALAEAISVGRSDANDIVLDDPFVSSTHVRLVPPSTVVDLDSTNGTFINDAQLHGRAQLHDGDRLRIGATVFSFEAIA